MILWSRPALVPGVPWCVVYELAASVLTLCDGRWDAREPREEASEPTGERCGRCAGVLERVMAAMRLGEPARTLEELEQRLGGGR